MLPVRVLSLVPPDASTEGMDAGGLRVTLRDGREEGLEVRRDDRQAGVPNKRPSRFLRTEDVGET